MKIKFEPKSTLSFIVSISLLAIFTSIMLTHNDPSVSENLRSFFEPLLYLGLGLWLVYNAVSLGRNLRLIK